MQPFEILNKLQIASPCPASWESMKGDDRVRFCDSCAKHVYNVAELTSAEALRVIAENEGHPCLSLYRRNDGTVLTADCPVGLRYRVRRRMLRMMTAGVVASVTIQSAVWAYAKGVRPSAIPAPPTGPGVTLSDWSDWALDVVGFRRPPSRCVMGSLAPIRTPPPAAPSLSGVPGVVRGECTFDPVVPTQEGDDL